MKTTAIKVVNAIAYSYLLIAPKLGASFHALPKSRRAEFYKKFDIMSKSKLSSSSSGNEENILKDVTTSPSSSSPPSASKRFGTMNPFRLAVLKLGFTEPAWTSPFNYNTRPGIYVCANCKSPLFDHEGKYDSGSGWPSFFKTMPLASSSSSNDFNIESKNNRLSLKQEWDGRVECRCGTCGGHLGHVFMDGPKRISLSPEQLDNIPDSDPKGRIGGPGERLPRFCVNGAAMNFLEQEEK